VLDGRAAPLALLEPRAELAEADEPLRVERDGRRRAGLDGVADHLEREQAVELRELRKGE
jgi:hypothetical protein